MVKNTATTKTIARRQHYVWRHYLEAWADGSGRVRVLRDGRSFPADTKNVMVQRDYYRVPPISDTDLAIVAGLTRSGSPVLDEMNLKLARGFAAIGRATSVIRSLHSVSDEDRRFAEGFVIEAEENIHGAVEREAVPMLSDLREQDTEFLKNESDTAGFCHYLAQQYFRTKRRREAIARVLAEMRGDKSHLKNLVCHLLGVNIGGALFRRRNDLQVLFVENATGSELITADQPIVNLLGGEGEEPPTDLALYYPLTPNLGMILAPQGYSLAAVDSTTVRELNDLMAYESAEFLVAQSADSLEVYATQRLPDERPSCRILIPPDAG